MNVKVEKLQPDPISPTDKIGSDHKVKITLSPSLKTHRKQAFWQIIFPLVLGSLIVVGLAVWAVLASSPNHSVTVYWANLSVIIVTIFIIIFGILLLALIIGLTYGVIKLRQYTPIYTQIVQAYAYRTAGIIIRYADHSVKPVYIIHGIGSGIKAFMDRFSYLITAREGKK